MDRRRAALWGVVAAYASGFACGDGAGADGTEILESYGALAGGMVFATSALAGANGYDLWWVPIPPSPTLDAQPAIRLTDAGGDEWQPSVSPGGHGLAYSRPGEGIFFVNIEGQIRRISNTDGTSFADSAPAVAWDGSRIAWVREDLSRPIGGSGFFETAVWMANFDGTDARALSPVDGTVQDAPKFEPSRDGSRVVWSEFSALDIGATGPQSYGIRVFDYRRNTDFYLCQNTLVVVEGAGYRCFGQHLAWPTTDAIVIPQNFLELYLNGMPATSSYLNLIQSVTSQNIGAPVLQGSLPGFFNAFPLSVSYQGLNRMLFDGVVTSVTGNLPSLGFFVAEVDGNSVWPLNIQGYRADYDVENTAGFLFSVATPQIIPATEPL